MKEMARVQVGARRKIRCGVYEISAYTKAG